MLKSAFAKSALTAALVIAGVVGTPGLVANARATTPQAKPSASAVGVLAVKPAFNQCATHTQSRVIWGGYETWYYSGRVFSYVTYKYNRPWRYTYRHTYSVLVHAWGGFSSYTYRPYCHRYAF